MRTRWPFFISHAAPLFTLTVWSCNAFIGLCPPFDLAKMAPGRRRTQAGRETSIDASTVYSAMLEWTPYDRPRQMTDRLDGIHALITGAARGIGAACRRR